MRFVTTLAHPERRSARCSPKHGGPALLLGLASGGETGAEFRELGFRESRAYLGGHEKSA